MKLKTLSLVLVLIFIIGNASCSASDQVSAEPQGMLKAFGLKGKVKTLTWNVEEGGSFVFAFDPQGNYIKCPDYKGGEITMDDQDDTAFCSVSIANYKITNINFSLRWGADSYYKILSYDYRNRPEVVDIFVNDEIAKEKAAILYTGSDSKGNYTKIHINHKGIRIPSNVWAYSLAKTIDVKIDYWHDSATMDDMPKPLTDSLAEDLIKKANVKQPAAMSKDLKRVVDIEANKNSTLINYGEVNNVPEIAVRISQIQRSATGESASVVFFFAPIWDDGKYSESDLYDNDYMYIADFVYENGAWKVDDIGWDLVYGNFNYYPGETYKNYHTKYK